MLRCGRNFAEATESSGVAVARLPTLWKTRTRDEASPKPPSARGPVSKVILTGR